MRLMKRISSPFPIVFACIKDQLNVLTKMNSAMFFNASLEELRRAGESLEGVAEVEEGGYSATIGVYHELHCLVSP
jgi:hypothetical protein